MTALESLEGHWYRLLFLRKPIRNSETCVARVIDMTKLISDILRLFRGELTKIAISRQLGFMTDQYGRWESGRIEIGWLDFLRVANVAHVDIKSAMQVTLAKNSLLPSLKDTGKLIEAITGDLSNREIARALAISPPSVGRLLAAQTLPSLEQVLTLIDKVGALEVLLLQIGKPENFPSHEDELKRIVQVDEVISEYPESLFICCYFELPAYRDAADTSIAGIARALSLPEARVQFLVERLLELQCIREVGGRFESLVRDFYFASVRNRPDLTLMQMRFWFHWLASQSASNDQAKLRFREYRVSTTTKATRDRIFKLSNEYSMRLNRILAEENRRDTAQPECLFVTALSFFEV